MDEITKREEARRLFDTLTDKMVDWRKANDHFNGAAQYYVTVKAVFKEAIRLRDVATAKLSEAKSQCEWYSSKLRQLTGNDLFVVGGVWFRVHQSKLDLATPFDLTRPEDEDLSCPPKSS